MTKKTYPAIPLPSPDLQSLYQSVMALKQVVETLGNLQGNALSSAVTMQQLVALGLITEAQAKTLSE